MIKTNKLKNICVNANKRNLYMSTVQYAYVYVCRYNMKMEFEMLRVTSLYF